jgi:hypothetical protein
VLKFLRNWYNNNKKKDRQPGVIIRGDVRKKFFHTAKSGRAHQDEEMYDMLYGKKVTAQMTAGAVGQPRLDKAALMAKRRAVRKACWESETEAVKEEVRAAMKLEKEQQEARGAMEVSLGIEKRSPMQIQE